MKLLANHFIIHLMYVLKTLSLLMKNYNENHNVKYEKSKLK